MRYVRLFPFALAASTTLACTAILGDFSVGTGSSGGPGDDGGSSEGSVQAVPITPATASVGALHVQAFTAAIDVTWTVQEGAAGGSIDASGKYIAPEKPGTYHVVATSKADTTQTGTAVVTVVPLTVTVIGGKPGGPGTVDGPGLQARFRQPYGLAYLKSPETLLVVDYYNQTIRKWDGASNKVTTIAGTPGVTGSADGVGAAASFYYATGVAISDDGKLAWVNDQQNHCVRQIDLATNTVSTLAGTCGANTSGHTDGATGKTSVLGQIVSMVLGPQREALYICDRDTSGAPSPFSGIRRVELATGKTTSYTPNTLCELASDEASDKTIYVRNANGIASFVDPVGGPAAGALSITIITPSGDPTLTGIAVMKSSTLNDLYSFWVQPFISHLNLATSSFDAAPLVGVSGQSSYVDGSFTDARFSSLFGMVADATTNALYVADGASVIRKVDIANSKVSTILGAPANLAKVDGAKDDARFLGPMGVVSDDAGNLYVADSCTQGSINDVIRKIDPTGTVTTFSGVQTQCGAAGISADGAKGVAKFGIPGDLILVGGALYVTDVWGAAIRKVDLGTGAVTTPFGALNVPGYTEGTAATAHFNFSGVPNASQSGFGGGLATDGTDIYVADTSNSAIRKLVVATGDVTTFVGGTLGNADGNGKSAQFIYPSGIAIDNGIMYVADAGAHVIKRVDMKTLDVTTWAGFANVQGTVDGDHTVATFSSPARIVADGNGALFVTEATPQSNYSASTSTVVRHIDIQSRTVTTFAGVRGQQGIVPGSDLPTTFNCPSGMSFDKDKNLMVADFCDGAIAVLKPHL